MNETARPVPSYRKPPIIEAVWSVQCSELVWLLPPHIGLFWSRIRDQFAACQEQPPIAHVTETEDVFRPPVEHAELLSIPPLTRQWFMSASGNELIQLQRDRICCNWRKVKPEDVYPRYEHMRQLFCQAWDTFCSFVQEQGQAPPVVDQCEMTYINHIDQGQGWDSVAQVGQVFPTVTWVGQRAFLPSPRTIGARFAFDVPELRGRLHVSLRHGLRKEEASERQEVLLLELTARGLPVQTDSAGLLSWYAVARETIVRGFTDLTTSTMHKLWERER
jgi:uncharacterized protein (TIGR04255 family)